MLYFVFENHCSKQHPSRNSDIPIRNPLPANPKEYLHLSHHVPCIVVSNRQTSFRIHGSFRPLAASMRSILWRSGVWSPTCQTIRWIVLFNMNKMRTNNKRTNFKIYLMLLLAEPVNNNQLLHPTIVAVVDKWSLFKDGCSLRFDWIGWYWK